MKKIVRLFLLISVIAGFSANGFAGNVSELSIGGTQSDAVGDKWGMNLSAVWWNEINYLFALGFNPQFVWFRWDKYVTDQSGDRVYEQREVGGVLDDYPVIETANAYMIPLHVVAKLQFPLTETITPFIKGGGGYTFMPLTYTNAETEMYSGLSWTAGIGCQFRVKDIPNFRFFVSADYRGSRLTDSDNVRIDMSGIAVHAGVQYGLTREKSRPATVDSGIVW
ncbi:MAG: hypothetical protein PF637_02260 [Spirochaetes bacterium]|jgi:opacity protein-like surface antigen|nr:hypothetical protein [Spirochaetota bacterium]